MSSEHDSRLLCIAGRFPGFGYIEGGAERHLEILAQNLPGYHVAVVANSDADVKGVNHPTIEVYGSSEIGGLLGYISELIPRTDLAYIVQPEVLYPDDRLAKVLDMLDERPSILRATSQSLVKRMEELPYHVATHLQRIRCFISQAPELTEQLAQVLLKHNVDPQRIHQIHNGVDTTTFHPATNQEKHDYRSKVFGVSKDEVIFVYSGRVGHEIKCANELIEAFNKVNAHTNNKLVLIGKYDDRPYGVKTHATHRYNDNIIFTGPLDHCTIAQHLRMSDVFVSASTSEGFSNATLEAMASGLPVITRKGVSGNSLMVNEGTTGYLFSEYGEFSEYMANLANDREKRKCMGKNAREHIVKNFTHTNMIQHYKVLTDSLVSRS